MSNESKNTEKAIKAWLALPKEERTAYGYHTKNNYAGLVLGRRWGPTGDQQYATIAKFTVASIVAKRYPRRKKKVGK